MLFYLISPVVPPCPSVPLPPLPLDYSPHPHCPPSSSSLPFALTVVPCVVSVVRRLSFWAERVCVYVRVCVFILCAVL